MLRHRAVRLNQPQLSPFHNVERVLQRIRLIEAKVDEIEPIQTKIGCEANNRCRDEEESEICFHRVEGVMGVD
jgi:hypothetical protein